MQIIQPPRVEQRPEQTCLGIRVVTPFRGMLRVRDELLAELYTWLASHDIEPAGPFFLRLHVIDMEGPMDLEVGVVTTTGLEGGRARATRARRHGRPGPARRAASRRVRHAYVRRSRQARQ